MFYSLGFRFPSNNLVRLCNMKFLLYIPYTYRRNNILFLKFYFAVLKLDKDPAIQMRERKKKTQFINIRKKRGDIATNPLDIKTT